MTGGMRLSRRSSVPRRVFSSKWLLSILLFSVSTKVIARAARRESTSGRRFASSRRLAGGAVGCSRGLLRAGRGRLPSMGAAFFRLPVHAFLWLAGCVDSATARLTSCNAFHFLLGVALDEMRPNVSSGPFTFGSTCEGSPWGILRSAEVDFGRPIARRRAALRAEALRSP